MQTKSHFLGSAYLCISMVSLLAASNPAGAVVGGVGGAILNYRNKGRNAAIGAASTGVVCALLAHILHGQLQRREERLKKDVLFQLDTFGVPGIAQFKKYKKEKETKQTTTTKKTKGEQ